jgi:hypothetical protein
MCHNLPENYQVQKSCPTCVHCFRSHCPSLGTTLFCVQDGVGPPPPIGGPYDEVRFDAYVTARDKWEEGRQVDPAGICPLYQEMPVS